MSAVLIEAGRSAISPDGAPAPSTCRMDAVVGAVLARSGLTTDALTAMVLADPWYESQERRARREGRRCDLDIPVTIAASGSLCLDKALRLIDADPRAVVIAAGVDVGGRGCQGESRSRGAAREVADRWDVSDDDVARWAEWSYRRSAACAAAGDFDSEIVAGSSGAADLLDDRRETTARRARGASAIILTSEENANDLGIGFRARLGGTSWTAPSDDAGLAPLRSEVTTELLAPFGLQIEALDQLEVPESHAVTPVAWIRETGISKYLVNPRGGDLGFGHLPRSGELRALVTMLHSLEATGGRAGALVAAARHRSTAFVLDTAA